MKIMPDHYTVRKLLRGWLTHFLFGLAIGFGAALVTNSIAHAIGYPTVTFAFREAEQYKKRRQREKPTVWLKVFIDVAVASLGGFIGMLARGLLGWLW